MVRSACCAMLLMLAGGLAQAQLHKWIGPDGRVHYTDSPPPAGAKTQEVQIRRDVAPPAPVAAASAAASSPAPVAAASAPAAAPAEKTAEQKKQDEAERLKQEQAEFARRRCDQAMEQVRRTLDLPATPANKAEGGANNFPDRTDRINRAKTTARQICGDKYREL